MFRKNVISEYEMLDSSPRNEGNDFWLVRVLDKSNITNVQERELPE